MINLSSAMIPLTMTDLHSSGTFPVVNKKIISSWIWKCPSMCVCVYACVFLIGQQGKNVEAQSRHNPCLYMTGFLPFHLIVHCTTLWKSALKWEPAWYCTCFVPVMLSGAHDTVLFVVCQFLTVHDRSEAISLNLQFKLGPLQPDYKSTFLALRSSLQWMEDISNHSAVNPSVR